MKSLIFAALAAVILPILAHSGAEARNRLQTAAGERQRVGLRQVAPGPKWLTPLGGLARRVSFYAGTNPTGMAARWCGRVLRMVVSPDPGPAFDAARAWARIGQPARPGPDVIVVWRHHVGVISHLTGPGRAVVISGNTGEKGRRRVMVQERTLAGAIAFRHVGG